MIYTIKKGKHYHSNFWGRIRKLFAFNIDRIFTAIPKEAWHKRYNNDAADLNKLHGVSGVRIHKNSARVAYVPRFNDKNVFDIYAYVYSDGLRIKPELLGSLSAGASIDSCVRKQRNGYLFLSNLGGWEKFIAANAKGAFRAFPFYGGDNPAEETLTFNFDYLDSEPTGDFRKWIKKYSVVIWGGFIVLSIVGMIIYAIANR